MLRCKDVSRIISESFNGKLPILTRIRLQTHLVMCKLCRTFRKTIIQIESEAKRQGTAHDSANPTTPRLSDAARERLEKSIR